MKANQARSDSKGNALLIVVRDIVRVNGGLMGCDPEKESRRKHLKVGEWLQC
jgi:hypothetical protein